MSNNVNKNRPGNVFGSVNLPAGVNIANAVRGDVQQIGIPDSRLDETTKIFRKALTDGEFAICSRGFGLGQERAAQVVIAEELKLDPNEVSKIARRAIGKLSQAPWRGRLLKLVPSADEVMAAYTDYASSRDVIEAQGRQNNGLRKQVENLKSENAALAAEKAELESQLAAMRKQLAEAEARADRAATINSELLDRMEKAASLAVSNVEENFDRMVKELKDLTIRSVKDAFRDTFEDTLGEELAEYLRGIGISSLGTLIKMSRRNLSGLKTPEKKVEEIEERLARVGLGLRAG